MNDDVNDAAWILVHCAQDLLGQCRAVAPGQQTRREFTEDERRRLCDKALLFAAVYDRYEVIA